MGKSILTVVGLGIGLVLFFSLNLLANKKLRMRADLTEENLYTLAEGSKRIAANLDEPIRLYLYFSEKVASEYPDIKAYGVRVREVLEEFELSSNGNIIVEYVNPEPFSEEEDRAVEEGVAGVRPPGSDILYFGLVGTNATDDREVIPFLSPEKERFLEYDISQMLYTLANPAEKVVGILSSLPVDGSPGNPMLGQQPSPPWQVVKRMGQFFETRTLALDATAIDADVSVLMLIHPKGLPQETLYAIDQYVLGGGKVVVFVDPFCEADQPPQDPNNPMAAMGASRASNLDPLLGAWGVELVAGKVLGDRGNAYSVNIGTPLQPDEIPYVAWVVLDEEALNEEDAVTSQLKKVLVAEAGVLRATEGATTTFTPLLMSSEDAAQLDVGSVQFGRDPERLLTTFVPEYQSFTVAARINGDVTTAYPGGIGAPGDGEEATAPEGHLESSTSPINVIVVADVDFLIDRYWTQETRIGNMSFGFTDLHDNGALVLNAVENLSGGEDLISIRARGSFSRPFTRIEKLQKDANEKFRAKEKELEDRLAEIDRRIADLQKEKAPGESMIFASPQQVEELEKAETEKAEARKKLREVRYNLNKDVERLELQLKLTNVLVMPAIVCAFAVLLWIFGLVKRSTHTRTTR